MILKIIFLLYTIYAIYFYRTKSVSSHISVQLVCFIGIGFCVLPTVMVKDTNLAVIYALLYFLSMFICPLVFLFDYLRRRRFKAFLLECLNEYKITQGEYDKLLDLNYTLALKELDAILYNEYD